METAHFGPDLLIIELERKIHSLIGKCQMLSERCYNLEQNNSELNEKINNVNEESITLKKQIKLKNGEENYGFFLQNIVSKMQDKEEVKTKLGLVIGELDKMINKIKKYN